MSASYDTRVNKFSFAAKIAIAFAICLALVCTNTQNATAQFNLTNGVVGGVDISPDGVLNGSRKALPKEVLEQLQEYLTSGNVDMDKAGTRMVSVKGLESAWRQGVAKGNVPAAAQYMAGLQRIEYVIRHEDDIIIAGPAEPFHADKNGNVVGKESGMPVLHTEDFIIALRHANDARRGQGISVSIDPTEAGVRNYQNLVNEMRKNRVSFKPGLAAKFEEAYGPQTISLTGIPKNSRFAQTLVSADYKMKRLAMGLEKAPGFLPSLMAMAKSKNGGLQGAPRFWMECNYEPVSVSADNKVWKLSGTGVKTMTEETHFNADGTKKAAGKENRLAKKWAETMTEKFAELSKIEPVFRELRNLMDLSVVAAIITKEGMTKGVSLPAVESSKVSTSEFNVPSKVPSECSFVQLSRSWLFTASGGVTVDSWKVASNTKVDSSLDGMVAKSNPTNDRWWWNAK